jgi:replicative DNA helicase
VTHNSKQPRSTDTFDHTEMQRHLHALVPYGSAFEVRVKAKTYTEGKVYAPGCYDDAARDCARRDGAELVACWVTMNGTTLAPTHDWVRTTTKDTDTARRSWLLLDMDPQREKNTNSTDAELQLAEDAAAKLEQHLVAAGWPEPLRVMSGNGYHVLYRVDLPADDGGLVQRVLQSLSARFSTPGVKLDTANHNPARIVKLAGTIARKGSHTPERPQRMARLLNVPEPVLVVTVQQLEQQCVPHATPPAPARAANVTTPAAVPARAGVVAATSGFPKDVTGPARADAVAQWLGQHGVQVKRTARKGSATWLYLAVCPVTGVESDGASDLGVRVPDDGPLAYKNQHNRGVGVTWAHLRTSVDAGYTRTTGTPAHTPDAAVQQASDPPDTSELRSELEQLVLQARATYSMTDATQESVLRDISTYLNGYKWKLACLHESLQQAQQDTDGKVPSAELLKIHGCTAQQAELLLDDPPAPEHVRAYVLHLARLHKAAGARAAAAGVMEALQAGLDDTTLLPQALEQATQALKHHQASSTFDTPVRMGPDVVDAMHARVLAQHGRGLQGLATNLPWFDDYTDGLRGLLLLAAPPGKGKTALALQLVRQVLNAEPDACCVFLSFELEPLTVYRRLLAGQADVPYGWVAKGQQAQQNRGQAEAWKSDLDDARLQLRDWSHRLLIDDGRARGSVTEQTLVDIVRAAQACSRCKHAFVVLDSLQACQVAVPTGRKLASDVEADNHAMHTMSAVQARLGQPLLLISEQNKANMDTDKITSVRGSARNIYRPDFVLLLTPPSDQAGTAATTDGMAEMQLQFVKARDGGKTGTVKVRHFYYTGNTAGPGTGFAQTQAADRAAQYVPSYDAQGGLKP